MHPLALVMVSAALGFRSLDPFHILLLRATCVVVAGVGSMGAGDQRCDSLRFAATVGCVLLEVLVLAGLGWSFSSRRALLRWCCATSRCCCTLRCSGPCRCCTLLTCADSGVRCCLPDGVFLLSALGIYHGGRRHHYLAAPRDVKLLLLPRKLLSPPGVALPARLFHHACTHEALICKQQPHPSALVPATGLRTPSARVTRIRYLQSRAAPLQHHFTLASSPSMMRT